MLQAIRDRAQGIIAWIIVGFLSVPFALFGIQQYGAPAQKNIVAEVNEATLSARNFQWELRYRQSQFGQVDASLLKQSTLENMIGDLLIEQVATDNSLRIGNALLAQYIRSSQEFKEDGTFSQRLYDAILTSQGLTSDRFETRKRKVMLVNQVRGGIIYSALQPPAEQKKRIQLEQQQRSLSYLLVPFERFTDQVAVTEADIEAHYNAHQSAYMTAEKVSVEYVELLQDKLVESQTVSEETIKQLHQERLASFTIPIQWHARHILVKTEADATPAQLTEIEQKAQALLARVRGGESFEAVAKEASDDTGSAESGGDLGWFSPGQMVKPFEEKVKSMQIDEISDPVKTRYGFHIIQLIAIKPETTKPFAEVRDTLLEIAKQEKAEAVFNSQVDQFATLAFEHADTLTVLADTLGLTIKTTAPFDHTGIEGDPIFSNRAVIDAAFSEQVLKEAYNSEVIGIEANHVVVLRLKSHKPAELKPLSVVKAEIIETLTNQKAEAETQTLAETLLQAIKQGQNPNTIAEKHNLKWTDAQWVKRQSPAFDHQTIIQAAFKMGYPEAEKAIYQAVALADGDQALVALLAVQEGTGEMNAEQLERYQIMQGINDFNQFTQALKAEAEIKIYNDNL